ncbi:hypothetical protein PUN28_001953 [Cardiocondyla obscurior]|uniref:Uncharacterized protein n=1 Tax=Cardiocondyla obscurior TaxID=286306 RepID=A0AAW2GRV0_9HYME
MKPISTAPPLNQQQLRMTVLVFLRISHSELARATQLLKSFVLTLLKVVRVTKNIARGSLQVFENSNEARTKDRASYMAGDEEE